MVQATPSVSLEAYIDGAKRRIFHAIGTQKAVGAIVVRPNASDSTSSTSQTVMEINKPFMAEVTISPDPQYYRLQLPPDLNDDEAVNTVICAGLGQLGKFVTGYSL